MEFLDPGTGYDVHQYLHRWDFHAYLCLWQVQLQRPVVPWLIHHDVGNHGAVVQNYVNDLLLRTCEVCLLFDTLPWFLLQNHKGHGVFTTWFLNCGRMVHRAGYYIPYTMQIFQFWRRHFGHCQTNRERKRFGKFGTCLRLVVWCRCVNLHTKAMVPHPFTTEWNSQPYCGIRYCDGVWFLFKHRCTCFALQLTWHMRCGLHSGWPGSNLWGFCLTLRWLAWECWASLWNLSCFQEIKAAIDLVDIEVAGSNLLDSLS